MLPADLQALGRILDSSVFAYRVPRLSIVFESLCTCMYERGLMPIIRHVVILDPRDHALTESIATGSQIIGCGSSTIAAHGNHFEVNEPVYPGWNNVLAVSLGGAPIIGPLSSILYLTNVAAVMRLRKSRAQSTDVGALEFALIVRQCLTRCHSHLPQYGQEVVGILFDQYEQEQRLLPN